MGGSRPVISQLGNDEVAGKVIPGLGAREIGFGNTLV
jgi:hypothetical protein